MRKCPLLIALVQVSFVGNPILAWCHFIVWLIDGRSYTAFACQVESLSSVVLLVFQRTVGLRWCVLSVSVCTRHNPALSLHPRRTGFVVAMMVSALLGYTSAPCSCNIVVNFASASFGTLTRSFLSPGMMSPMLALCGRFGYGRVALTDAATGVPSANPTILYEGVVVWIQSPSELP